MTSSLLAPAYDVALGDKRWTTQALDVAVTLQTAPLLDHARIVFPAAAPVDVGPDDPVVIALDAGAGDGPVAAFTGKVTAVGRGIRSTTIECSDAGADLAAYRPATTFEQSSASSVIEALCSDVGVEPGAVDAGPTLTAYVADPGRSALDHILRLAGWSGALVTVDGEGRLTTRVLDGSQPDVAIRYGREVIAMSQRKVATPITSYVVVGEAGASSASPPDSARPTSDFFAGDRPEGPGAGSRWTFEPAFRTPDDAAVAGAAQSRTATSTSHRTTLEAWLLPAVRAGSVVRIDDLPDGLSGGPHWVERVSHRLGPNGATTTAHMAEGGEAFDPMALLMGALGGLL
jgi:hypothetical protein